MTGLTLKPHPLTAERFRAFGDVIETRAGRHATMNEARFERFNDLCNIDIEGRVSVGIARCRTATSLPYRFDLVERHPLGSQAFVPLDSTPFVVVVGPPAQSIEAGDLRAFITNGHQGVNYHRGTWHMPLVAFATGQQFLVIDRADGAANCDEHVLDETVLLLGD